MQPTNAVYSESKILVPTQNEADSLYHDGYGLRLEPHVLTLEPYEALYLMEKERLTLINEEERRTISFQELLGQEISKDRLLWTKYIIYRDIRGRGFVAKESKEGNASFIVYERGSFRKNPPAYSIYTVYEGMSETIGHLEEVLNKTEITERSLKLAVVDRRGEVIYYSLGKLDFDKLRSDIVE